MTNSARITLAMAALAAFALWPRRASASALPSIPDASGGGFDSPILSPPTFDSDWLSIDWDRYVNAGGESLGYDWQPWADPYAGELNSPDAWYESFDSGALAMQRLRAFLYMIRLAEHRRADVESGMDYRTVYGGDRFVSYTDHPVITREWSGRKLTDQQCRDAGFNPGCVSTAAGAYQIIRPTWLRVRAAGAWGPRLPDFSPASQDEAARRLLIESGALAYVEAGDFARAVRIASGLWASLPGSTANQRPKTMAQVTGFYNEGLALA